MAELEEECIFTVAADKIKLTTQTNGDIIILSGLNFTKNQAACFAWLINHEGNLEFEVKLQEA